jgi:hypothetical protein
LEYIPNWHTKNLAYLHAMLLRKYLVFS